MHKGMCRQVFLVTPRKFPLTAWHDRQAEHTERQDQLVQVSEDDAKVHQNRLVLLKLSRSRLATTKKDVLPEFVACKFEDPTVAPTSRRVSYVPVIGWCSPGRNPAAPKHAVEQTNRLGKALHQKYPHAAHCKGHVCDGNLLGRTGAPAGQHARAVPATPGHATKAASCAAVSFRLCMCCSRAALIVRGARGRWKL